MRLDKLFWNTGNNSDVTVKCGKTELKLHKCVLIANSEYFKAQLSFEDKDYIILDTESVDENWTIKILESLYSGEQIKYFGSKFMEYIALKRTYQYLLIDCVFLYFRWAKYTYIWNKDTEIYLTRRGSNDLKIPQKSVSSYLNKLMEFDIVNNVFFDQKDALHINLNYELSPIIINLGNTVDFNLLVKYAESLFL